MNTSRELSSNNPREYTHALKYLIGKGGLGYCCEHVFFKLFNHLSSSLIAARLGVTIDTVTRHRRRWERGEFACEGKSNCIRRVV